MIYQQRDTKLGQATGSQTTTVIAASSSQRIACAGAFVRFAVETKSVWAKFGSSTVDATAGTSAEFLIPAGQVLDTPIPSGSTHVAIIQSGATAVGSVTVFA